MNRQSSTINSQRNEPLVATNSILRKKSTSFIQSQSSIAQRQNARSSRQNASEIVSEHISRDQSQKQQSSVRSVKIEDPGSKMMDENDTYRLFVNDDPVSTSKALNSRIEKLSASQTPRNDLASASGNSIQQSNTKPAEVHHHETANFPLNRNMDSDRLPEEEKKEEQEEQKNLGLRLSISNSEHAVIIQDHQLFNIMKPSEMSETPRLESYGSD